MDHLRVLCVSFLVYGARCLEVLFCFVWTCYGNRFVVSYLCDICFLYGVVNIQPFAWELLCAMYTVSLIDSADCVSRVRARRYPQATS